MAENKPEATAATAQSQEPAPSRDTPETSLRTEEEFCVSPSLTNVDETRPYERRPGDPVYRPLKIFTLDPSISKLEGAIATLKIPYEKLQPGPKGAIFEVDNYDGFQKNQRIDLDDPLIIMNEGLD